MFRRTNYPLKIYFQRTRELPRGNNYLSVKRKITLLHDCHRGLSEIAISQATVYPTPLPFVLCRQDSYLCPENPPEIPSLQLLLYPHPLKRKRYFTLSLMTYEKKKHYCRYVPKKSSQYFTNTISTFENQSSHSPRVSIRAYRLYSEFSPS